MADVSKQQQLSPARLQFLQQMGQVIIDNFFGAAVGPDGTVSGTYDRWVPMDDAPPLDTLYQTMKMVGLDPSGFQFQPYAVFVSSPYLESKGEVQFPAQLIIKSDRYRGIHELDLVLRNPFVTATEIHTILTRA